MKTAQGYRVSCRVALALLTATVVHAQIFGSVRGTVSDPQGRRIAGAAIRLQATASAWVQTVEASTAGDFSLLTVPAGTYSLQVESPGFRTALKTLAVGIGTSPQVQLVLDLASANSSVDVAATLESTNPDLSSPPVSVSQADLRRSPGADRSGSLSFVTNFAPGSYMLHNHLHMRGGHQVAWLVDGVPIPNTNVSSSVGRQVEPGDVQNVEIGRGGFSAQYGDRAYGNINIVPRSGFEFDREGELTLSYGSFNQTNDQLRFGGHSKRLALYGSLSGSRTDLGLEPPSLDTIHNSGNSLSGFTSIIFDAGARDQLRLAASVRRDRYQIPLAVEEASPYRDIDSERDSFMNFSWVRTLGASGVLTVSPFYHYNRAAYDGGPASAPLLTDDVRASLYSGVQATLRVVQRTYQLTGGLYGFVQKDNALFQVTENAAGKVRLFTEKEKPVGSLGSVFLDGHFEPAKWLRLNPGVKLTHFQAGVSENAANPRLGLSIIVPKLRWVVRGYYGRYYQAPPLSAVSGALLEYASDQGLGYLPLRGERDRQTEFGLTIPWRGWTADFSRFQTSASNFFDHEVLGNSNISLPLTIQSVRVRGWEATVRSPEVWRRVRVHAALSNQVVKGRGRITGGLTDFAPPEQGYFYIDHDQRNTVSLGGTLALPWRAWLGTNVNYGSGFLDLNGPNHLPPHTTADFSVGKPIGEAWSVTLTALNLGDTRFLLGRDNAFAGTHYNDPRQVILQLRFRFRI